MRKMNPPYANRSKYTAKPSSPGEDARKNAFVWAIVVLIVALTLSLIPTPFYLVAPGNAVDLSTRLRVEGRPPAPRRFYLTDVTVAPASVLLLVAGFMPGVRVVRRETIVPSGESARSFDRQMADAMDESQNEAAIVAERAAGYAVAEPPQTVVVRSFLPSSHASPPLAAGDAIVRVGSAPVVRLGDLAAALRRVRPGAPVVVGYVRDGRPGRATVVTVPGPHGARLGVRVVAHAARATLPVPVRFTLGDIAGSSGGLMFALEIYDELRPGTARDPVAGTGTIDASGRVGPIEGAPQKVLAARRAGIGTFLVPRENYAQIAGTAGIRIVPVSSFRDALAAIGP
jgi:PDZ domain-containing protein